MKISFGRALNFQESMEETAKFSKYLFTSPEPYITVPVIFLFSILLGYLFFYPDASALPYGLVIFFFPALITGFLTKILVEGMGGRMYLRRSFLLVLLSLLLPMLFGIIYRLLSLFAEVRMLYALYAGIASIGFFRHFVGYAIALPSHTRAAVISGLHVAITGIPLFLLNPQSPTHIVIFSISTALFMVASIVFLETVSYPMKRFFGVKAGALVKPLLDHLTDKTAASARELEEFLDSISSYANLYCGVIGIKTRKSDVLIVVPAVHPGPFSMIGGGNLPAKLKKEIKDWKKLMVPHGSATHDFNLSTTEECKKVARFAEQFAGKIRFTDEGSEMVRVSRNNFSVCAQFFGDTVLIVATSAPHPTDDIDYPTGIHAVRIAQKHAAKVVFVDAHNCLVKGSGAVRLGMEKAEALLENVELAVKMAAQKKGKMRIGFAETTEFKLEEGIGPSGIQVLFVECNGRKNAYVLIDGNNMVPGLREKILAEISGLVDDAEVMTTDNHIVNATFGGFNPVGRKVEHRRVVKTIRELVERAAGNLVEAETGGNTGIMRNLRVFGHETAPRLTTVMNTSYTIIWPMLGAMFLLPSFLSILLMYIWL
ncbi:MAG: DUF2070 family protein [Thermoplasmata archaeon]|nr:DUF2070 family protein [Thermoplasmata archaeon]